MPAETRKETPVTAAVEASGLVQRYGRHTVLDGVDLTIRSGGVTGLVGPNGAGKTTLLSMISTLRRPAGGQLRVLGLDPARRVGRAAVRRRTGFLPQTFGYVPSFTVEEFVAYAGWLKGLSGARLGTAVRTAVERVHLAAEGGKTLGRLSGGMLRRAGIASAIVHEPELLLLDEPTAGLDPDQRMDFRALLGRLGERGTVLLSTHLIEDVAATCTDVVVIRDGSIAFSGRTSALAGRGDPTATAGSALERGYATLAIRETA
jgi:ABC-type multidrug transport system ATPase subunit